MRGQIAWRTLVDLRRQQFILTACLLRFLFVVAVVAAAAAAAACLFVFCCCFCCFCGMLFCFWRRYSVSKSAGDGVTDKLTCSLRMWLRMKLSGWSGACYVNPTPEDIKPHIIIILVHGCMVCTEHALRVRRQQFLVALVTSYVAIDDLRKSKGLHSVSAYGHGPVYRGPWLRV